MKKVIGWGVLALVCLVTWLNMKDELRIFWDLQIRPFLGIEEKRRTDLPKTLEEAIDILYRELSRKEKLQVANTTASGLHFGLGMYIRNDFGLWGRNPELLLDIQGNPLPFPDDVSGKIVEAFRDRVRAEFKREEREQGKSKLLGGRGILKYRFNDWKREPYGKDLDEPDAQLVDSVESADLIHARFALQHGANPNLQDINGGTLLMNVLWDGEFEFFLLLSEFVEPENEFQKVLCIEPEALLGAGVTDFNQTDWMGRSLLMYACQMGDPGKVRFLLENGADVSAQSKLGLTAHYIAIRKSNLEIVKLLLDHGASSNQLYLGRLKPIMLAVMKSNKAIVRLLVQHGASISEVLNTTGDDRFRVPYEDESGFGLEDPDLEPLFIDEFDHWDLLHLAAIKGDIELMETLAKDGNLMVQTGTGRTVLDIAVENLNENLVGDLLDHGFPIDHVDEKGCNALHWLTRAREWKQQEKLVRIAEMLVEAGLDPRATNHEGDTPLVMEERMGHEKLVAFLEQFGCPGDEVTSNLSERVPGGE